MLSQHDVISALEEAAITEKDDEFSNELSRMANRLGHVNSPFEKPLTDDEMEFITTFTNCYITLGEEGTIH